MGRACSMQGKEKECIEDFGVKARRKETTRKTCRWEYPTKMDLR
jgi:hypothetical protein